MKIKRIQMVAIVVPEDYRQLMPNEMIEKGDLCADTLAASHFNSEDWRETSLVSGSYSVEDATRLAKRVKRIYIRKI